MNSTEAKTNQQIAIEVKDLSKAYKLYANAKDRLKESFHPFKKQYHHEFYALDDINIQVAQGQTTAIIGRNGSGKSTLLQCICGIVEPTSGSIKANGRIAALLELGAGFNPEFTGRDNLFMNAALLGYSREQTEAKLDAILKFADIGEFIDQPVRSYSSGMFVRLAFSVAIHVEPDILIVDEALAVGDIHFQAKCFEKLHEFREKGVTVIFVTHDLNMVTRYCDNAYLLNGGKIIAQGEPRQVVAQFRKLEVGDKLVENEANNSAEAEASKNPHETRYGNNQATIVQAAIYDASNNEVQNLDSGAEYSVKFRVRFNESIDSPIFAYTFVDAKGTVLMGTNTKFLHQQSESYLAGDVVNVSFTQSVPLVAGNYFLSVGCVGFKEGELVVYERRHHYLLFQVVSQVETIGVALSDSVVRIDNSHKKEDE